MGAAGAEAAHPPSQRGQAGACLPLRTGRQAKQAQPTHQPPSPSSSLAARAVAAALAAVEQQDAEAAAALGRVQPEPAVEAQLPPLQLPAAAAAAVPMGSEGQRRTCSQVVAAAAVACGARREEEVTSPRPTEENELLAAQQLAQLAGGALVASPVPAACLPPPPRAVLPLLVSPAPVRSQRPPSATAAAASPAVAGFSGGGSAFRPWPAAQAGGAPEGGQPLPPSPGSSASPSTAMLALPRQQEQRQCTAPAPAPAPRAGAAEVLPADATAVLQQITSLISSMQVRHATLLQHHCRVQPSVPDPTPPSSPLRRMTFKVPRLRQQRCAGSWWWQRRARLGLRRLRRVQSAALRKLTPCCVWCCARALHFGRPALCTCRQPTRRQRSRCRPCWTKCLPWRRCSLRCCRRRRRLPPLLSRLACRPRCQPLDSSCRSSGKEEVQHQHCSRSSSHLPVQNQQQLSGSIT